MVIVERVSAVCAILFADRIVDSTFDRVDEAVWIASTVFWIDPFPAGAESEICWPQPGQNFAPGKRAIPHFGQNFVVIVLYSVRVFT
jgi:hypothetical protein